jgi:uncharacterized membrane protein YadS
MKATEPTFAASVTSARTLVAALLPGIVASIAIAVAAVGAGSVEAIVFGRAVIEPLVLAILFGMVARAFQGSATTQDAGVRFVAKDVLELAVCLLGATMDVPRLFASGPALAAGIVATVGLALSAGYAIGRLAGLSPSLATLVACPAAVFFSLRRSTSGRHARPARRGTLVPWFVLGFIALASLRSFGILPDAGANAAKLIASWLTIVAMAASDWHRTFARFAALARGSWLPLVDRSQRGS